MATQTKRRTTKKAAAKVPAHRVLPPADEIVKMKKKGWTHREIAAEYGTSTAAVSVALARAGLRPQAVRYDELIPWRVRADHHNNNIAHNLRAEARRRRGLPVSEDRLKRLDAWLADLYAKDLVVGYHREHPGGWYYTTRRPGIDQDIIDTPDR